MPDFQVYVVESPSADNIYNDVREGDLIEYWGSHLPDDWLWEIEAHGWKSQESERPGFISGRISEVKEYLVVGLVDCLSVLSSSKPVFTAVTP